jgi:hypothetical protein
MWLCMVKIKFSNQQNTMTSHVTRRVRIRSTGYKVARQCSAPGPFYNFPRSHLKVQAQSSLKQCPLLFHPHLLPLFLRLPPATKSLQLARNRLEEPSLQRRSCLPRSPQPQRRLQQRKWLPNLQLLTTLRGRILSRYISNSILHPLLR